MNKKMPKMGRRLFCAGILAFLCAGFLPIWRIEIWAPQYPEGLFMQIGIHSMSGNVDQINILNHYVGMKHIVPSQIPELNFIPWVFAALVLLGACAAMMGSRILRLIWLGVVALSGLAGIADLYRWGYDYGHNLNPHAPIIIPGMSYQPPLIGDKILLNIHSYSLPDWGGYLLGIAFALALAGVLCEPHPQK